MRRLCSLFLNCPGIQCNEVGDELLLTGLSVKVYRMISHQRNHQAHSECTVPGSMIDGDDCLVCLVGMEQRRGDDCLAKAEQ